MIPSELQLTNVFTTLTFVERETKEFAQCAATQENVSLLALRNNALFAATLAAIALLYQL